MSQPDPDRIIPLLEEQVHVTKHDVVTDHARVVTHVDERAVLIEDELERGDLHIERRMVELPVREAPAPRQDGDTLVVSVVEERLVVEKRLFVIEEVRITRTSSSRHVAIPETVRTMRATVEHAAPAPSTGETHG